MIDMIHEVISNTNKPKLFEYTGEEFWNDPHISKQMLEVHINPNIDAASRNANAIKQTVDHLFDQGIIKKGMKVLDLGCGPGLYSQMIQSKGAKVVGIDCSENSIRYAKDQNNILNLGIEYYQMDFFDMPFVDEFDVVLQIYGEVNTFSPYNRDRLFGLIRRALKKDGIFAFDVTTRASRDLKSHKKDWYAAEKGFWSKGEHIVLEQSFDYPEDSAWLDQYIIINSSNTKVIRNWFLDYDLDMIKNVISNNGFTLLKHWKDLAGGIYTKESKWIGLVTQKL